MRSLKFRIAAEWIRFRKKKLETKCFCPYSIAFLSFEKLTYKVFQTYKVFKTLQEFGVQIPAQKPITSLQY